MTYKITIRKKALNELEKLPLSVNRNSVQKLIRLLKNLTRKDAKN